MTNETVAFLVSMASLTSVGGGMLISSIIRDARASRAQRKFYDERVERLEDMLRSMTAEHAAAIQAAKVATEQDARAREVLGVNAQAGRSEIVTAYRKLARQHHPDHNPGDTDAAIRFTRVCAAYQRLTKGTPFTL